MFALLMEALTSTMKSGAQTRTEGTEALPVAHGYCKKQSFCLFFALPVLASLFLLVCFLFCLDFGYF